MGAIYVHSTEDAKNLAEISLLPNNRACHRIFQWCKYWTPFDTFRRLQHAVDWRTLTLTLTVTLTLTLTLQAISLTCSDR